MRHTEVERLKKDPEAIDALNDMYVASVKDAIRSRRKFLGLTQTELASLVGMNQPTISVLENPKKTKVSLETLQRVAAGLGCVVSMSVKTKSEALEEIGDGS